MEKIYSSLMLKENPDIRLRLLCECDMDNEELYFLNPITNQKCITLDQVKIGWKPSDGTDNAWKIFFERIERHLSNGYDLCELIYRMPEDILVTKSGFKLDYTTKE